MYVAHNRRLSQGDICDIAAHESPVSHLYFESENNAGSIIENRNQNKNQKLLHANRPYIRHSRRAIGIHHIHIHIHIHIYIGVV